MFVAMKELQFKKTVGHDDFLNILPSLIAKIRGDISEIQEAIHLNENKFEHRLGTFSLFNAFPFFYLSYLDILVLFKSFINSTEYLEHKHSQKY